MTTPECYKIEAILNRTDTGWEYTVMVTDKEGDYVQTAGKCETMDVAVVQLSYSWMLCLNDARGIQHG